MIEFLKQSAFVTAVIAWFVAQVIKVITVLIAEKKFDFSGDAVCTRCMCGSVMRRWGYR